MAGTPGRMDIKYTAEATSSGDARNGHVRSSDGIIDQDMAMPKEMGGPGGATNPEQLFAAGYAACFDNAMIRVARRMRLSTGGSRVTARVGIGAVEGGRFQLAVELLVTLPEVEDQAQARAVLDAAHQVCPYSNATRGNIDVTVTLVPAPDVD
jgi:lipoyl-dependent peroxiredoxin